MPIPDFPFPSSMNYSAPFAIITSEMLQNAFTETLKTSVHDLAAFEQLRTLIIDHLDSTRGLIVWDGYEGVPAYVSKGGIEVFSSVSWIACIEWALKQPYIESDSKE